MQATLNTADQVLTVHLSGEIDHHSVREVRQQIDREIEINMPALLVMDFSSVTFMDSSGIGLVLGRYRILSKNGAELAIIGCSPHIYKLLQLSGIEKLAKLEERGKL